MRRKRRAIIMWMVLFASFSGLSPAAPDTPPASFYLELQASHALSDMGTGISISASPQGEVIVADASRSKYYRLQPDGKAFEPYTPKGLENRFVVPQAVCHDDNGSLWIANSLGHEVLQLSPEGSLLRVFGSKECPLEKPVDLASMGAESVHVLDAGKRTLLGIQGNLNKVVVRPINNLALGAVPERLAVERNMGMVLVSTDRQKLFRMDGYGNVKAFDLTVKDNPVELGDFQFGLDGLLFATAPSQPGILAKLRLKPTSDWLLCK